MAPKKQLKPAKSKPESAPVELETRPEQVPTDPLYLEVPGMADYIGKQVTILDQKANPVYPDKPITLTSVELGWVGVTIDNRQVFLNSGNQNFWALIIKEEVQ